jgi:hypothetical protein
VWGYLICWISISVWIFVWQDLQRQLADEIDRHQHELSALQDAHRQTMSAMKKSHKVAIDQLQQQLQQKLTTDQPQNTTGSTTGSCLHSTSFRVSMFYSVCHDDLLEKHTTIFTQAWLMVYWCTKHARNIFFSHSSLWRRGSHFLLVCVAFASANAIHKLQMNFLSYSKLLLNFVLFIIHQKIAM